VSDFIIIITQAAIIAVHRKLGSSTP